MVFLQDQIGSFHTIASRKLYAGIGRAMKKADVQDVCLWFRTAGASFPEQLQQDLPLVLHLSADCPLQQRVQRPAHLRAGRDPCRDDIPAVDGQVFQGKALSLSQDLLRSRPQRVQLRQPVPCCPPA